MAKKDNPTQTNLIKVIGLSIILEFRSFIMITKKTKSRTSNFREMVLCFFKNKKWHKACVDGKCLIGANKINIK